MVRSAPSHAHCEFLNRSEVNRHPSICVTSMQGKLAWLKRSQLWLKCGRMSACLTREVGVVSSGEFYESMQSMVGAALAKTLPATLGALPLPTGNAMDATLSLVGDIHASSGWVVTADTSLPIRCWTCDRCRSATQLRDWWPLYASRFNSLLQDRRRCRSVVIDPVDDIRSFIMWSDIEYQDEDKSNPFQPPYRLWRIAICRASDLPSLSHFNSNWAPDRTLDTVQRWDWSPECKGIQHWFAVFQALELLAALTLTQPPCQADPSLREQQRLFGRIACTLSKSLDILEDPVKLYCWWIFFLWLDGVAWLSLSWRSRRKRWRQKAMLWRSWPLDLMGRRDAAVGGTTDHILQPHLKCTLLELDTFDVTPG